MTTCFELDNDWTLMDIFCQPLPSVEINGCGDQARSISSLALNITCETPGSRYPTANDIKNFLDIQSRSVSCPPDPWALDTLLNTAAESNELCFPSPTAKQSERQQWEAHAEAFWSDSPINCQNRADSHGDNSLETTPASSKRIQQQLEIDVQPAMWSTQDDEKTAKKQLKQRSRTNKQAFYWTPEDHAKFVIGLEEFGLRKGLGPGGAALMASYMGNRTIPQIKSHFQKYSADLARGMTPSPGGRALDSLNQRHC